MVANVTVVDHVTTKEDTSLTIKTTSLSLLGSHPGDFKLASVGNTTTAGAQFQTSVTTLANGGFVVAWTDTSYSGGDVDGDSVKAQLFDASDNKVGNDRTRSQPRGALARGKAKPVSLTS
jgi:hypothetical protein